MVADIERAPLSKIYGSVPWICMLKFIYKEIFDYWRVVGIFFRHLWSNSFITENLHGQTQPKNSNKQLLVWWFYSYELASQNKTFHFPNPSQFFCCSQFYDFLIYATVITIFLITLVSVCNEMKIIWQVRLTLSFWSERLKWFSVTAL